MPTFKILGAAISAALIAFAVGISDGGMSRGDWAAIAVAVALSNKDAIRGELEALRAGIRSEIVRAIKDLRVSQSALYAAQLGIEPAPRPALRKRPAP